MLTQLAPHPLSIAEAHLHSTAVLHLGSIADASYPFIPHRYALCALLGTPLMLLNDLGSVLAVRVHVWAGLFTAGFGTLWGD